MAWTRRLLIIVLFALQAEWRGRLPGVGRPAESVTCASGWHLVRPGTCGSGRTKSSSDSWPSTRRARWTASPGGSRSDLRSSWTWKWPTRRRRPATAAKTGAERTAAAVATMPAAEVATASSSGPALRRRWPRYPFKMDSSTYIILLRYYYSRVTLSLCILWYISIILSANIYFFENYNFFFFL